MSEYKDTINLPITDFPMKASLAQREPETLRFWKEINVYQTLRQQRKHKQKFILHDGPPYANGDIHIGHAVNKVLKDIVVKSQSLNGFDSPYIPGWDCHGLPIEHIVEKKHGKAGDRIQPKAFRDACRNYAKEQMQIQRDAFIRLGVLGDWENPYLTMDPSYEANIIRSFAKIIAKGHLIQGKKPVYWCVDCGSALAEAEVEYKDKQSPAIYVRFNSLDPEALIDRCQHSPNHSGLGEGDVSIVIWTTTPWTLPANQAVAVHPDLEYVLVQVEFDGHKERLLLAEGLLQQVMDHLDIEHYRVVAYCRGDALENLKVQHPFYQREVPIVLGEHVNLDAGTGAVHTAPGHGQDDYVVGLKYNLEVENPVNDKGVFNADTELFAGEHVNKANDHIIEVLKAKNALIHVDRITHSYPHCWRHKTPLLFRATQQWFISMDKNGVRRTALEEIFKVNWLPETGRARLSAMINNRPDWCVSRQRSWGVPMTLFVHTETGELHPDTNALMESVAQMVEKDGIEAWFQLEPETLLGHAAKDYRKVTDILDVWFESGVSHECVLKHYSQLKYPAEIYLEGSDQHRGWFQSSLLTAVAMGQSAPYKEVLTHGFTVDAKGYKMSKSIGNVIAPEDIIKNLGADILRLWIASADYRGEIAVSDEIFKRTADTYRRLRNTARYLLSNLFDFDPALHAVPATEMLALDKWAVDRARILQQEIIAAYNEYQFHLIYQKVHHFCSIEMGSFYLDIIKDRQYTTKKEGLPRRSAQTAMYYIAEGLVRWLAPILSFTAEEIWRYLPGKREPSVFLSTWFENYLELSSEEPLGQHYWNQLMLVRDEVNKELEQQRNAGKIGAPLDAEVTLYCHPQLEDELSRIAKELRFVLITSYATVLPLADAPHYAAETSIEGLHLVVTPSAHEKCVRCWQHREDVGAHQAHPELCGRCIENVVGEGEERHFA